MRFTSRTMLKLTSFLACTTSIWGESIDISSRDCYYLPPLGDIVRVERASASQTNPVAPQQRGQINQNTYDKIQRQHQEIAKAVNEVLTRGAAEAKAEHRKIKESRWASEEKTYRADSESFYRFKAKVCRERAEWCSEDGKRDEGSKYSAEARAFEEMANRKCVEQDLAPSKNWLIQAYGENTLEYWREMLTALSCQERWYQSQHQKLDILIELQIEAERRHLELQRQATEQERRRLAEEQERHRLAEEQERRQREQELEQARANAVRRHSYNTVEYWEEMMEFHRGRFNRYSYMSDEYGQEGRLFSEAMASRDVLRSQAELRRRQAEQQEFRGWRAEPEDAELSRRLEAYNRNSDESEQRELDAYIRQWQSPPIDDDEDGVEAIRRGDQVREWARQARRVPTDSLGYCELMVEIHRVRSTWFPDGTWEKARVVAQLGEYSRKVADLTEQHRIQTDQVGGLRVSAPESFVSIPLDYLKVKLMIQEVTAFVLGKLKPKRNGSEFSPQELIVARAISQATEGSDSDYIVGLWAAFSEERAKALFEANISFRRTRTRWAIPFSPNYHRFNDGHAKQIIRAVSALAQPDPRRPMEVGGNGFTSQELGFAAGLMQLAPSQDPNGYMTVFCLVFSEERAKALFEAIINSDEVEEEEEVIPSAAVGAAQPAVAGQFDQEERARRSAQEESDRQYAELLHQEEMASRSAQEERDRAAAQQLLDQDAGEEAEVDHVGSDVQRLLNRTFQEAQNARARIPLRRADQLSEQEVRQLVRSWEQPKNSPNPKRDGKTYTTEEYTGVATFIKGKDLTDCAMKRVLSEIFTPERAESLAYAIYMGGVEGDENLEDEAEAEAEVVEASTVAQNARRHQSQSQLRPGVAARSVATHSRRPLASSAYDEEEVD